MQTNNLQANIKYEKHIRDLQLEEAFTAGKVCKNKDHNHAMATTFSCLRIESK